MKEKTHSTAPGRARTQSQILQCAFHGLIPIDWLIMAARLPGKSLHVGLAIWLATETRQSREIALSNVDAFRFGLNRNAKYRAMQWLEDAGLIAVERRVGRSPIVTMVKDRAAHD